MSHPTNAGATVQNPTPVVQEPLTAKDRVVGALVALVFLGLAASMIRWPVLPVSSGDVSASRTRGVVTVVELIWSRPVGVVLGLLGLF